MTLNPGTMRDRITIQKRASADSITGDTFTDLITCFAQFRPTRGREFREGSVALGEQRATFTVQYIENVEQIDRIVHHGRGGDRIWKIQDVVPIGFKDGTDIHVTRVDANN